MIVSWDAKTPPVEPNFSDKSKAILIAFAFEARDVKSFEEAMREWGAEEGEDWIGWLKCEGIISYEDISL